MSEDRTQICETVYRYATGIDTRDWDLYRSIFSDEVEIDVSLGTGRSSAHVWTCDLSYDYVRINAEYTT